MVKKGVVAIGLLGALHCFSMRVAITNLRAFGFSATTGRWAVKRFGLK